MTRTHQLTAILTRPPATRPAIPAEGYAVGTEGASAKTGMTPGGFLPVASELAKAAAEERSTRPSQLLSAVAYLGDAFERALTERIERLARDFEAANRPHAPNTAPRMKSAGDFVQSLLLHAFIFCNGETVRDRRRRISRAPAPLSRHAAWRA